MKQTILNLCTCNNNRHMILKVLWLFFESFLVYYTKKSKNYKNRCCITIKIDVAVYLRLQMCTLYMDWSTRVHRKRDSRSFCLRSWNVETFRLLLVCTVAKFSAGTEHQQSSHSLLLLQNIWTNLFCENSDLF